MEINYGALLEKRIRRSGHSISAIARKLKVSRSTLYYWFSQSDLNAGVIFRIERIIQGKVSYEHIRMYLPADGAGGSGQSADQSENPAASIQRYLRFLEDACTKLESKH